VNERREIENVTEIVRRSRLRDTSETRESTTMTVGRIRQMTNSGDDEERMVDERVGR